MDQILDIGAGIEVGVAPSKTFLGQLVDDHDRRCEELAHLFADTQDWIFLGRGINSRLPFWTRCCRYRWWMSCSAPWSR